MKNAKSKVMENEYKKKSVMKRWKAEIVITFFFLKQKFTSQQSFLSQTTTTTLKKKKKTFVIFSAKATFDFQALNFSLVIFESISLL